MHSQFQFQIVLCMEDIFHFCVSVWSDYYFTTHLGIKGPKINSGGKKKVN